MTVSAYDIMFSGGGAQAVERMLLHSRTFRSPRDERRVELGCPNSFEPYSRADDSAGLAAQAACRSRSAQSTCMERLSHGVALAKWKPMTGPR
jgi:hypothetical protein